jgi:hypothetical protein
MTSSRHSRAARRRRWLPLIVLVLVIAMSSACGGGGGFSDQGQGGAGGGGPEEEAGEPPPSDEENAGGNGPAEEEGSGEPPDDGDAGASGPVEPPATSPPSDVDRCARIVSANDRAVAALDDLLERPDAGPEARNAAAEVLEQAQSEIASQLDAVTSDSVIDAGQRVSDALGTAAEHLRAGEPAPAEELIAAGRSLEAACGAG